MKNTARCKRWRNMVFTVLIALFYTVSAVSAQTPQVIVQEPEYDPFEQSTAHGVALMIPETEFRMALFRYGQVTSPSGKIISFMVVISGEWTLDVLALRLKNDEVWQIPINVQEYAFTTFVATLGHILVAQNAVDDILSLESDVSARLRYRNAFGSYNFDFPIPWEFWVEVAAIQ